MKELILSWIKADNEESGSVMIDDGKRILKIVPKYRKTASPIGVFLTLLEVFEYLGLEKDSGIIDKCSEKPEEGQSIILRQK